MRDDFPPPILVYISCKYSRYFDDKHTLLWWPYDRGLDEYGWLTRSENIRIANNPLRLAAQKAV